MLALVTGKQFTDNAFWSLNDRRKVFHAFPNGTAPLTSLLSLVDSEETDNPEFGWFEKRYVPIATSIESTGTKAFTDAAGTDNLTADATLTAGTLYRVKVTSTADLKPQHVLWFADLASTNNTVIKQLKAVVDSIISSTVVKIRVLETITPVDNDTAENDAKIVRVIGTANEEGASSGNGRIQVPCNPSNYTQIFRTPFGFSRTALKSPTVFDKSGVYKETAKDSALDHMTEIEMAFLFGPKTLSYVTNADGESVPIRTTGGMVHFLKAWEAADSVYRGGTGAPAITSIDDLDKRILEFNGAATEVQWKSLLERAFRRTNNKASEKLLLAGSGMISVINDFFEENKITVNKNMKSEDTYGMNISSVETVHGTLLFKSHPLFADDATLRYSGFILDVNELRYRALNDSDTTLLRNRQANDADRRKDEWLTEAGFECRYPEAHMYIQKMTSITPTP